MIKSILILLLLSTSAWSQQKTSAQEKKRTVINFEDELVEGDVNKPELSYLLQKKQFNFGKLIKLRENFLPEMRKTAEIVERAK
jgi:hypothetical protein